MNCKTTKKLLSPFVDGDLSDAVRQRVQAHLDGCESCRAELFNLRQSLNALSNLPADDPGDEFNSRVMSQLAARKRDVASYPERRSIQGVFAMKKAVLAAVFAVVLIAAGFWFIPGHNGNQVLADIAQAMAKVESVYFTGYVVREDGRHRAIEGWIKGPNKIRITVDGMRDIADNGERLIAVERDYLPKVTLTASGTMSVLARGMTYTDLFSGPGAMRSALEWSGAQLIRTKRTTLPGGRPGLIADIRGFYGDRMRIVIDARTHLLVGSETYNADGRLVEVIDHVVYDIPIDDGIFYLQVPDDLPVLDMIDPTPDAFFGDYDTAVQRLEEAPNATLVFQGGAKDGGTCGYYIHPNFLFSLDVERDGPVAIFYLADRNVYRVIGKAQAYKRTMLPWQKKWAQVVENGDIRLPGEPQMESVLMLDAQPGEHGPRKGSERPHRRDDSLYFEAIGAGKAMVTYHQVLQAYIVRGTVKWLPSGRISSNEVVRPGATGWSGVSVLDWGNLPPDEIVRLNAYIMRHSGTAVARCIDAGGDLNWGDLPSDALEAVEADLDVALRLDRIRTDRVVKGVPIIDGEIYEGTFGSGSYVKGIRLHSAGPNVNAWMVDIPSKKAFYIIGRARIDPGGNIVKNAVVNYDGEILYSEE